MLEKFADTITTGHGKKELRKATVIWEGFNKKDWYRNLRLSNNIIYKLEQK